jgi:hypothetical protein
VRGSVVVPADCDNRLATCRVHLPGSVAARNGLRERVCAIAMSVCRTCRRPTRGARISARNHPCKRSLEALRSRCSASFCGTTFQSGERRSR